MKAQLATQKIVVVVKHKTMQGTPLNKLRRVCGQVCDIQTLLYIIQTQIKSSSFFNISMTFDLQKQILASQYSYCRICIVQLVKYFGYKISVQIYILLLKQSYYLRCLQSSQHKLMVSALSNGRFGSMTINQKTNLYQQAENFCRLHQLDPNIAVYLQSEMFQEVLKIKEQMSSKEAAKPKSIGKISKNNAIQNVVEQLPKQQRKFQHSKDRSNGSILHQSINYTITVSNQQRKARKSTKKPNSKHFQEMFKRHEQIESKKQLSRKASIQKIPFKPVINSLSRKIVDLKRNSSTSKFVNCSSQKITVYRDGKENDKQKMPSQTVCKSGSKNKIKQIKIRIQ